MFGLFKNKKFKFDCPLCGDGYTVELNPSDIKIFDYEYFTDSAFIGKENCKFCKNVFTIIFVKYDKKLKGIDEKWEIFEKEHELKVENIEDELDELNDQVGANIPDKKIEKKIAQMESKLEKLEASYDKKVDRYDEKKGNLEGRRFDRDERLKEKFDN